MGNNVAVAAARLSLFEILGSEPPTGAPLTALRAVVERASEAVGAALAGGAAATAAGALLHEVAAGLPPTQPETR